MNGFFFSFMGSMASFVLRALKMEEKCADETRTVGQ
jgi:hypothetical protein